MSVEILLETAVYWHTNLGELGIFKILSSFHSKRWYDFLSGFMSFSDTK